VVDVVNGVQVIVRAADVTVARGPLADALGRATNEPASAPRLSASTAATTKVRVNPL